MVCSWCCGAVGVVFACYCHVWSRCSSYMLTRIAIVTPHTWSTHLSTPAQAPCLKANDTRAPPGTTLSTATMRNYLKGLVRWPHLKDQNPIWPYMTSLSYQWCQHLANQLLFHDILRISHWYSSSHGTTSLDIILQLLRQLSSKTLGHHMESKTNMFCAVLGVANVICIQVIHAALITAFSEPSCTTASASTHTKTHQFGHKGSE